MSSASLLALFANLFFSAATISYARYSKAYGSLWVNSYKSFVSLFLIAFVFVVGFF